MQRRGDKQRRRERDLDDNKDPRDHVHQAAAVTATAFFHHFRGVTAGAQNRGHEPGQERREEHDAEGKGQDFAIDGELDPIGQREWQSVRRADEETHGPLGEEHADDRAHRGKEKTFRHHLADQTPAGGSEGSADREFFGAQGGAAELHVHHVHTSDHQHEKHRAEHRVNGLAQLRTRERIQQRLHVGGGQVLIRFRVVFCDAFRERGEFRVRLVERNSLL